MGCKLSLVIPAKDINDPKLDELLASIERQDFPKDEMETLVITEGTSESAKAIGIRRSKGEVIGILASDNELIDKEFLTCAYMDAVSFGASSPACYHYDNSDNILNRYFALIGGNDPLSYYMGKNDRSSYLDYSTNWHGSVGDNGFFIRKELIEQTDLDNYFHVDNALESGAYIRFNPYRLWHKTGGNIISFFLKRYRYADAHAFNPNRRWKLVDLSNPTDVRRLLWFIFCSITLVEPIALSIRGYLKIRDMAWFMHPVMCLGTVFVYGLLIINRTIRSLFQSLSAPMGVQRA